ncbi:hypothetical protein CMQ_4124 [Grosmannia clavigera kw1407]|uniref:Uncharacterized protein n=1 Tax=Grosmannia clavigera (strain kw1407 / UAMH 11150) TaxID=655863 RepID=F0X8E8_GROCL|nr:uncharacterized protein CMQ_4124 [Grosmannia clavigera kw1407]EFX06055.1 hypothetical protein CMQ_4124 [Grosmannia clavigera kw1407]
MASKAQAAGNRRRRLAALADEWQVGLLPPPAPIVRPLQPLSVRIPADDQTAEELLKEQRLAATADGQQQRSTSLSRTFTTLKKRDKAWEPREIFVALDAHIDKQGSPGVAEALIAKLVTAGGDINVASTKTKTSLLTRRRSVESFERGRLLQRAIEHGDSRLVAILVPYADSVTLDGSLPGAILSCHVAVVEHLVRYGASASATSAGRDAFRKVCSAGGQEDIISVLLASGGCPLPDILSPALVDAVECGCTETVRHLSRASADGSFENASALLKAIAASRVDLALAILTGSKPPSVPLLNEAFYELFRQETMHPNEKMAMAESLLCAGASGDAVASAVDQACLSNFSKMVSLLISYGAPIEHENAITVRRAISQKQIDLARILLASNTTLRPQYASECVALIPKHVSNEERREVLELLLRKGASGIPLHDCLIDAVEAGDISSTQLLLTPHFSGPERQVVSSPSPNPFVGRKSLQRHHTASAEHKEGMALQLAVQTMNFSIVDQILAVRPAPEILANVFPSISLLSPEPQYQMYELFLATGFSGPCVSAVLQRALEERPSNRDSRLIALLLRHIGDTSQAGGAGVLAAVTNHDISLLNTILQNSQPTVQTVAAAMPQAMAIDDLPTRRLMVRSLLIAGAGQDGKSVAEALVTTLSANPVDGELLHLLLDVGLADVNYNAQAGSPVTLAAINPDPRVLDALLKTQRSNRDNLVHALYAISNLPFTDAKAVKLNMLLQHTQDEAALSYLLVAEVEAAVKNPPDPRILSVIKTLLAAGADINARNAAALCHAVTASNVRIVEMFLVRRPSPDSLATAISRIFSIPDAMDRLSLAKVLLEAGVPAHQASCELKHAVVNTPDDIPLLRMLAEFSDPEHSGALLVAVQQQKMETVSMLLSSQKFAVPVLNSALVETMRVADKGNRQVICNMLVKAGATGTAVSDSLLSAAQDADLDLCHILLANGAKIGHQDGQAIVLACRSGAVGTVEMLLQSLPPTPDKDVVLVRAFHEAGLLDDLAMRETLFRLLLEHGLRGDELDKQLVSAVSHGDDGIPLIRLLLEYGASPNYSSGEAVWTSTRNSFLPTLELLLGLEDHAFMKEEDASTVVVETTAGENGPKPSQETMVRALKASWMLKGEDRYQVIKSLFAAGLKAGEAVHVALKKAVRDSKPNLDLVSLLLSNGASPLEGGCQTLVDATWRCLVPILELCLAREIPSEDLNYIFAEAFAPSDTSRWLSDDGVSVARLLLEKGSRGDGLPRALIAAIRNCGTDKDHNSRQLIQLLVKHGVDVNFEHGQPLQDAAKHGSQEIVRLLLSLNPDPYSAIAAFQLILESGPAEEDVIGLITLFNDYRISGDACGPEIIFNHSDFEPVVFRAMSQYPRSVGVLDALLNSGYYHDQMTTARVVPEIEENEPVSLLFWALLQPQKKISSAVVELLIQRGSKVNFETSRSRMTPLMLAIQNKRQDLVETLITAGANIDIADYAGNTPLFMAVCSGGDAGLSMVESILGAEPSRNDGSLHMAARNLNVKVMKLLVQHGHEVDFPSDLHDGRSALAEICLHGSDGRVLTASALREMEYAISYLIKEGSDVTLRSDGKTPLLLALEAEDPVGTTQVLLKAGMHKYVNKAFNQYDDGTHIYSPTMYVSHVRYLQPSTPAAETVREKLLGLLRRSRTEDVYYAHSPGGKAQPKGAVGVPEELLRAERERQAREERVAAEDRDHERARRQAQELAELAERTHRESMARERAAILERAQAYAEAARVRELGEAAAHAEAVRMRIRAETEVKAEALQLKLLQQEAEQVALLEQSRTAHEQQLQLETDRKNQLLIHEKELNMERVSAAKQISDITLEERRALDQLNEVQNRRERARLEEGRRLADAIREIPGANGAIGSRNMAGYIMGEET